MTLPLTATKNLLSQGVGTEDSLKTQCFIGFAGFCPSVLLSLYPLENISIGKLPPPYKDRRIYRCFICIKALFLLGFLSKLLSGTEVGQKWTEDLLDGEITQAEYERMREDVLVRNGI